MIANMIARCAHTVRRTAGVPALVLATGLAAATAPAFAASDAFDVSGAEAPRVAFVIGNQRYDKLRLDPLLNPVNDGKLIAGALRRLEFDVVEGYDLTLEEMTSLFRENRQKIDNAEAVVLYYAGHGFQLEGENYVVPVDATLERLGDIPLQAVQLDAIVAELEDPDRPTLIFMDACRESPLPPSADVDAIDGLAQIEAGKNTFVAFSTEPGKISNDGAGKNSPFALALATHIETPGQSVSDLMIAVRNETQELTLGQQTPWTQESLQAQFYFTDRQELDPEALRLVAAEVLQDPRQLQAFLEARNDEGLGFLPAIFRARQRAVSVIGQPAPLEFEKLYSDPDQNEEEPAQSVEIASTPPAASGAGEDDAVLEALMFARLQDGKPEVPDEPERRQIERAELARLLQTELQRLGCYRMAIDGIWGPGSRGALRRFLEAKGQPGDSLEPTRELLNRTMLESGRICREPVIIKRQEKPKVAARTPARQNVRTNRREQKKVPSFRRRAPQGQSRPAQRARREQRREALPPDLQMGVGIGL